MNLFDYLLPCSAKQRLCFNSSGSDSEEVIGLAQANQFKRTVPRKGTVSCFSFRMGANASSTAINTNNAMDQPCSSGVAASNSSSTNNPGFGLLVRERKKKATGFATLRKKFIRRRRSSKTCDHGRMIRELVSDWSPIEIAALLEEYEALAALKDLSVQAELARPPATTFKQDLSALYDYKYCTDADLIFRGACFPVHRAILSARCPYFRDLLSGCPGYGARICLELNRSAQIDVNLFSALLRYLYTGDICPYDGNVDLLRRLSDEFGTPNLLEHDLRYLLETGDYSDAALVFTSDSSDFQRPDSGSSEYGFRPKLELACHKAILSARSPFFRNLIQRRSRNGEEHTERALHIPTRIVLDETVIPKRYARVLLHAVYLDTVDLSLILRGSGCSTSGSLGEVQALTSTGRMRLSPLEEAMELYQIGRFLELDILVQGCEDIILEWLTINSLPTVLRWSSQAHGSAWVYRQAMHFLREEFHMVVQSPILYQLDKEHLLKAIESNFLQASELEILQAVLKWGEHELSKRMEDREPNILNYTTHSVSRKGVKKRDLNDNEIRELIADFLPLIRIDHILPPNSDSLAQAIKRGLISTPPSCIMGGNAVCEAATTTTTRANVWIRCRNKNGLFVRPRFFMPYYEELKLLVEDQIVQDLHRIRMHCYMPDIPDTLYMLEDKPRVSSTSDSASNNELNLLVASIPLPDPLIICAMLKRINKLKQTPICQRATESPLSSRQEINQQIRLRVVREFNLPDAIADLLDSTYFKYEESAQSDPDDEIGSVVPVLKPPQLPPRLDTTEQQHAASRNLTFPRLSSLPRRHDLPAIVTEREFPYETEARSCSDGHLSEIMPDVAMATSSFGQLQLQEQPQELQLDLGDGNSHVHGSMLDQHNTLNSPNSFVLQPQQQSSSCYRYMSNISINSMNYYNPSSSNSEAQNLKPNNFFTNPRFL